MYLEQFLMLAPSNWKTRFQMKEPGELSVAFKHFAKRPFFSQIPHGIPLSLLPAGKETA